MINKRILIKNLLAYTDENTFLDKKRQLNLHIKDGKAKFLKHICALSNSNPENRSFIIVGIEDKDNEIVGTDFFDDSRIQNLVNAYLENPPSIQYENVLFAHLEKDKVVGLVTIQPNKNTSFFKKGILSISKGSKYHRIGSNSLAFFTEGVPMVANRELVESIEKNSRNSIEQTLKGVLHFITVQHKEMKAQFKVFKELFVLCWAGIEKKIEGKTYLSRVDIELTNEQVRLFYSALDEVQIRYDEDTFVITEYLSIELSNRVKIYEFERVVIRFNDNGSYQMETQVLFNPPKLDKNNMYEIYRINQDLIADLKAGSPLSNKEKISLKNFPYLMMLCYVNGLLSAKDFLIEHKEVLKNYPDPSIYLSFKSAMRILRKIKYEDKH